MSRSGGGRHVLDRASDVPVAMVDEIIEDMALRMTGTPESRSCVGLSFAFVITDQAVRPARYQVAPRGRVTLSRDGSAPATFTFTASAEAFDVVLRGRQSALSSILRRRISMRGSLTHLREILRMVPAVHRAYEDARTALIARHSPTHDFRF